VVRYDVLAPARANVVPGGRLPTELTAS
jgi:hypothetical protein